MGALDAHVAFTCRLVAMDTHEMLKRLRRAVRDRDRAEKEIEELVPLARDAGVTWEELHETSGLPLSTLRSIHYRAVRETDPDRLPPSLQTRIQAEPTPRTYEDGSVGLTQLADRLDISRQTLTRRLEKGQYGERGTTWYREPGARGAIRILPEGVERATGADR